MIGDWPQISIVTPSLNQGQYLEETIRSVLLQRYPNLEYIVIDGGSTDQSINIIKKYEGYITFWSSEQDRGQSDAINKGLRRATGDIYAWINSDDYLAPGVLWEAAKAYQNCADKKRFWIVFAIECINEGTSLRTVARQTMANNLDDWLKQNAQVNQQGSFWAASITKEIGYLHEDLQLGMDTEYFMRMVAHGYQMECKNRVGGIFRLHATSKSANFFEPGGKDQAFGYDWARARLYHLPKDHPGYKILRRHFHDQLVHFLIRFAQNKRLSVRKRLAHLARAARIHPKALARHDFLSTLSQIVFNYPKDA